MFKSAARSFLLQRVNYKKRQVFDICQTVFFTIPEKVVTEIAIKTAQCDGNGNGKGAVQGDCILVIKIVRKI
jgi:hypothetical protein